MQALHRRFFVSLHEVDIWCLVSAFASYVQFAARDLYHIALFWFVNFCEVRCAGCSSFVVT